MDETTRALLVRTGLDIIGCYKFVGGPEHADERIPFFTRGTKRSTVEVLIDLSQLGEPLPAIGPLWGLLDSADEPRYVAETIDLAPGRPTR